MRKLKSFIVIVVFMSLSSGCNNADSALNNSMNQNHVITLYSGGEPIKVWHSKGHVEYSTGRAYFEDKSTGKLVEIYGTMSVERE